MSTISVLIIILDSIISVSILLSQCEYNQNLFDCIGRDQSLNQYDVRDDHKDQVVEELQSFSGIEFEQPGDLQQSVMITRPSDHELTTGIMDAPTITTFQVFEPLTLHLLLWVYHTNIRVIKIQGSSYSKFHTKRHTLVQLRRQQMSPSLTINCWRLTVMDESTPMWIMTSL